VLRSLSNGLKAQLVMATPLLLVPRNRDRECCIDLVGAFGMLNERERRIFEARRLADEPVTLEKLANEFGVSRERVRQIEIRACERVQKAVKSSIVPRLTCLNSRRCG